MATKSSWIPLSQLCEAIVDCEHKTAPIQDSGIPSIRTTNIKNGRLDLENANRVSEETYKLWTARLEPQPNDLILAREAPVGEVGIVPPGKRVCLGQRTVLIRPDGKKLFPRYLLYLLLTPEMRHELTCRAEGSVVPHLNMSDIRNFEIPPPPPLDEQKAIAHILGTLDDKIELNQQMNRTLEAIARALFKSWFIDFGPVRAKLDGRQPAGMDAETAALFPAEFEDSAIGKIPKGWKATRWGELTTLEYGKSLRNYQDAVGPYRVYGTNGPIGWHTETLCHHPGIIIGRKGAYRGVHYSPYPFFVIDTAFYLKPKTAFDWIWAYYELSIFDINSLDSGSAIPSTSRDDFYSIPVCLPTSQVLDSFGAQMKVIYTKREAHERESETLASIRDVLLPKLLSGEICVKEAEEIVAEVA